MELEANTIYKYVVMTDGSVRFDKCSLFFGSHKNCVSEDEYDNIEGAGTIGTFEGQRWKLIDKGSMSLHVFNDAEQELEEYMECMKWTKY